MEGNFNPFDLMESMNYSGLAVNLNSKSKMYFIYDFEYKFETIRMFICEMQEAEIVATHEVTNGNKRMMFRIYLICFESGGKLSEELIADIYSMLDFEEKYFDNE